MSTSLVAPYWRFRADGVEATADVHGCSWTCDGCWSSFGWHTTRPRHELEPAEVIERLLPLQTPVRITGGEPALHWAHMVEVMVGVAGQRPIFVETNGCLIGPGHLRELDRRVAGEVTVVVGMKASDPRGLATITGLPYAVAVQRHRKQLANVFAARTLKRVRVTATVLDKYARAGQVSAMQRAGLDVETLPYEQLGKPDRFYTPKRKRGTNGRNEEGRG